jgi:hypothetical protein
MGLKSTDFMGAIPAIGGRMDKEDRGFLVGLLPGLIYKESQKNKKKSSPSQQVAQASNVGKRMKRGGKVSSSKSKKKGYKCSHNRLY